MALRSKESPVSKLPIQSKPLFVYRVPEICWIHMYPSSSSSFSKCVAASLSRFPAPDASYRHPHMRLFPSQVIPDIGHKDGRFISRIPQHPSEQGQSDGLHCVEKLCEIELSEDFESFLFWPGPDWDLFRLVRLVYWLVV